MSLPPASCAVLVLGLLAACEQQPGKGSSDLAVPVPSHPAEELVALSCPTPGAVIRYTLDGSEPESTSGPYLAPIELPAGGVVKARAFSPDRARYSEVLEMLIEPVFGVPPKPSTLVACTQDRDAADYDWAKRHEAVVQLVRERKPELVFVGDSITHRFGGEPRDRAQPGASVWERHYGNRNAANLGFGSDRIENALWRLRHGELDGAEAKAVVILVGTNNLDRNSPVEIADGIHALCSEVQLRQPAAGIVLMALFPRGQGPDVRWRRKADAVNQLLAGLDGKDGVTLLDVGARFLEPNRTLAPETMDDFLHPTAQGYEIWARELEPVLARLLGDEPR